MIIWCDENDTGYILRGKHKGRNAACTLWDKKLGPYITKEILEFSILALERRLLCR